MRPSKHGPVVARFCAAFLSLSCFAVSAYLFIPPESTHAVPPVVHSRPHPFDPDWLLVKNMLAQKCTGCHRPQSDRSNLATYEAVVFDEFEGMRMVSPGRPDESLLLDYVDWNVRHDADSDAPDSPMMPTERHEWLTEGQLATLRRWLENGALQYKLPPKCNIRPLLETDFPSARQCKECHPKQYSEWSRSMHAYAQHSPIFEAFNLTLVERTGGTIGTFCSRCHTPVGTALGENESLRNVHRSRISMEGVTCVTCHRRAEGRHKSSGRVTVRAGGDLQNVCMYGPFESDSHSVGAHKSAHLPYLRRSQFCGECHDVTSPEGVRLEEAFSEWNNSPAAKDGISCHLCHMGPIQGQAVGRQLWPLGRAAEVPGVPREQLPLRRLSDHTFAGPDYSMLPDTEFPEKLDWMYEVDYTRCELTPYQQRTLIELRRRNRKSLAIAREKRYELLRNAARIEVTCGRPVHFGKATPIRVDVHSTTAGHSFPTGFTAERQVWISLEVRDQRGRVVFVTGDLDHNHDLRDDHSREVLTGKTPADRFLLNFQNKFVARTNKGNERTVSLSVNRDVAPLSFLRPARGLSQSFGRPFTFRVAKNSLPPLGVEGRTYLVHLPEPGVYCVTAQLNFRHLPPNLFDHIGTPHLKHLLEIVVIDERRLQIESLPADRISIRR